MADIYKVIHPNKYYNHYVEMDRRPDGRDFQYFRPVMVNVGTIKTADGSSLVKFGNTTVVCGIKLELAAPKADEPDAGYLVMNVELPPLCSPKYRPGPPSDHAQVLSTMVNEIIAGSKCVDLKQLCIIREKMAWVVYCEMCCLDYDGSVVDVCIAALMAAFKNLTLPHVEYDPETEECVVDTKMRTPLNLNSFPITSSFAIYKDNDSERLVTDPNTFEEELCGGPGANFTVCWNKSVGSTLGVQKMGGHTITAEMQQSAFKIAEKKATLVEETIDTALKNTEMKL